MGRATVAGIDADKDGVRDDIQRYVASAYPASQKKRAALQQAAVAAQEALLAADEADASATASRQLRAVECLYFVLGDEEADTAHAALVGQILNTGDREARSARFNRFFGGQTIRQTSEDGRKNQCDFNPNQMEN